MAACIQSVNPADHGEVEVYRLIVLAQELAVGVLFVARVAEKLGGLVLIVLYNPPVLDTGGEQILLSWKQQSGLAGGLRVAGDAFLAHRLSIQRVGHSLAELQVVERGFGQVGDQRYCATAGEPVFITVTAFDIHVLHVRDIQRSPLKVSLHQLELRGPRCR